MNEGHTDPNRCFKTTINKEISIPLLIGRQIRTQSSFWDLTSLTKHLQRKIYKSSELPHSIMLICLVSSAMNHCLQRGKRRISKAWFKYLARIPEMEVGLKEAYHKIQQIWKSQSLWKHSQQLWMSIELQAEWLKIVQLQEIINYLNQLRAHTNYHS